MSDSGQDHDWEVTLNADSGDPVVGVNVLSEFAFCRRAGLIEFESRFNDSGIEQDAMPRLDFLPDYSIEMLESQIEGTWSEIYRTLTWSLPVLTAIGIAAMLTHPSVLLGWAGVLAWMLPMLFMRLKRIAELAARIRAAERASPHEPNPNSTAMQQVNWWELLKAGFQPVEYEDPHEVPAWKLIGSPWRVLVKGSLRIPVFRKRKGADELHPQHFARMAAYCVLLEKAEGGESPYGIVLFGHDHDGVTIPNTEENRNLFAEVITGFRHMVEDVASGRMVDIPNPTHVCVGCPKGYPRKHRAGRSETTIDGTTLEPHRTRGTGSDAYHSTCGDRYRWVPPHDVAKDLDLC